LPLSLSIMVRSFRMSLLFALDFQKVPPTPTSKINLKGRVVCLTLASRVRGTPSKTFVMRGERDLGEVQRLGRSADEKQQARQNGAHEIGAFCGP
jgi:hypothetical protein